MKKLLSKSVKLNSAGLGTGKTLDGGATITIYANGGRVKAQDSIKGIWIKFFDGVNEVDEYANPTTLTKKNVWNE